MPTLQPQSRPLVIQTEHLSADAARWLAARCELFVCPHDSADFPTFLPRASGLVVRTYTIVNKALLDAAPNLRVVARAGAGVDNIDVPACRARNIQVVYSPDANTQAVVEYFLCLLGDALRPRTSLGRAVDSKEWTRLRDVTCAQHQFNQLTLGILGLGRVGKRIAAVAAAIGMPVLYNDLIEIPLQYRAGAHSVSVDELFSQSDIVSIHIDGRPSNRHFVSASLIDRMKPEVLFINTSRGLVIDNSALAKFLKSHTTATAMLDVHDPEPFGPDYPLLGLPNARLYPHLASRTQTAMENMSWVVRDVVAVLEGRTPQFPAPM